MKRPHYHIIIKTFKDQASPAEQDLVAAWAKSSMANEQELLKLRFLWDNYGWHHESLTVDVDQDFAVLTERIVARTRKKRSVLKIAACISLFILVGITAFYSTWSPLYGDSTYTSQQDGKEVTLPDGTLVTLRAGSKITLHPEFNHRTRSVSLQGEAYFNVVKDESRPFYVKNNDLTIKVLGTSFLVSPQSDRTEVALFSGKVEVYTLKERLKLFPDQTAIHQKGLRKKKGIAHHLLSWKTQRLDFRKEKLNVVFKALENHYRIRITASKEIENRRLTAVFKGQSIGEVLHVISSIHHLKIKKRNRDADFLITEIQ